MAKFDNTLKEIEQRGVVKCESCGKLLDAEGKNFISIKGNIYLGIKDGIVGNNFIKEDDPTIESNEVNRLSIFCETCVAVLFDKIKKEFNIPNMLPR